MEKLKQQHSLNLTLTNQHRNQTTYTVLYLVTTQCKSALEPTNNQCYLFLSDLYPMWGHVLPWSVFQLDTGIVPALAVHILRPTISTSWRNKYHFLFFQFPLVRQVRQVSGTVVQANNLFTGQDASRGLGPENLAVVTSNYTTELCHYA